MTKTPPNAGNTMPDAGETIAAKVEVGAEAIMRAAGSSLRHYESYSKRRIKSAVLELYEEAYRAGAAFATEQARQVVAKARGE